VPHFSRQPSFWHWRSVAADDAGNDSLPGCSSSARISRIAWCPCICVACLLCTCSSVYVSVVPACRPRSFVAMIFVAACLQLVCFTRLWARGSCIPTRSVNKAPGARTRFGWTISMAAQQCLVKCYLLPSLSCVRRGRAFDGVNPSRRAVSAVAAAVEAIVLPHAACECTLLAGHAHVACLRNIWPAGFGRCGTSGITTRRIRTQRR
jgi:hypothetical protein